MRTKIFKFVPLEIILKIAQGFGEIFVAGIHPAVFLSG
jgi:hypothetical protein